MSGGLARAAVFGINDGLVSNVSLILGFAGSGVGTDIVRLAGFAGAVAGAISMAAGEWISISAQNELIEREVSVERRALADNTDGETAELAAMYRADGMSPEVAEAAAADVMANPARALAVHARAEMGVDPRSLPSPLKGAAISFVCFFAGALLPLLPWLGGASGAAPAHHLARARRDRRRIRRCRGRQVRRTVDRRLGAPSGVHRAGRLCDHLRHRRDLRRQHVLTASSPHRHVARYRRPMRGAQVWPAAWPSRCCSRRARRAPTVGATCREPMPRSPAAAERPGSDRSRRHDRPPTAAHQRPRDHDEHEHRRRPALDRRRRAAPARPAPPRRWRSRTCRDARSRPHRSSGSVVR